MNDTLTMNKRSIKRCDYVILNHEGRGAYGDTVYAAGTKCIVWKVKRDGMLYMNAESSHTIQVHKSSVTLVSAPAAKVKVGDIFSCSWGYEQTNLDFYKITAVLPQSVKYVAIGETRKYTGPMCGETRPDLNCVGTQEKTSRIRVDMNGNVSFKLNSYSTAFSWNGEPKFFSEWH